MTTPKIRSISRRAAIAGSVGLALGGCSFGGSTPAPLAVTGVRTYPAAVRPGLLVIPSELAGIVPADECERVRVLDVRPIRDYRAGHIPSARHAWWQDTVERNLSWYGGVLRPDEDTGLQTKRQALLDLWDLPGAHRVVVYDDHPSVEAARVVWFLSFLGFPRVGILDGGYAGWLAQDIGDIERSEATASCLAGEMAPQTGYYLLYEQVLNRLAEAHTVLLDVRTDTELRDTVDGTVRPGVIPGSISWPWTELLDADRRLRPAGELTGRARSLGLSPTQRVILVGRFATDCALSWLALQLIGFLDVPTYDGGWMEWSTRPDAPVAWL